VIECWRNDVNFIFLQKDLQLRLKLLPLKFNANFMLPVRRFTLRLFTILLLFSASAYGQNSNDSLRKDFEQFNINGDYWLDGIEINRCKCLAYDFNGDKEVSFDEFRAGRLKQRQAANKTSASTTVYNATPQRQQPITISSTIPPPVLKSRVENKVEYLQQVLNFGKVRGWATIVQERIFNRYVNSLTSDQQQGLVQLINTAVTPSAKFFALKSLIAGDTYETLKNFIADLNKYPEAVQQERCLVYSPNQIIQQWQYSCSITTVQTYLADLCPRYAWEVKKIDKYNIIANDVNHPMAQQQKIFLEKYGGLASLRGDVSGKAIGLNGPINELVGPLLGVRFYAQQATEELPELLAKLRGIIDNGMNVPLHITFMPSEATHFILMLKYKYEQGQYHYLIYDPWEGRCNYVSASSLQNNSLAPVLTQWKMRITYYYPTEPIN
jgi:hypothetical protein